MNYWKTICTRWNREELSSWGSLKKTAYMILPLLVYFLIHDAAEILLWAGLNQFMLVCKEETADFLRGNSYTVQGIVNGLAILTGVVVIWKAVTGEISERKQPCAIVIESKKQSAVTEKMVTSYMMLGTLAFLSALGLNVLFYLLGIMKSSQAFEKTASAQFGVAFWAGLVLYGILSPVAEEAVFRGLMYNRMKRCFNYPIALAVSSLLFGCYHGNIVQAVYGTLLGFLIAYTYEKYESFSAPVLFHAVANVSIFVMTYYNGLSDMSKSVGIVITAASLVGAVICLWYIKKKLNSHQMQ